MSINNYSEMVASNPILKDYVPVEFDEASSRAVHDLSLEDWRKWLPYAIPPFDKTYVQINPRAYLSSHGQGNFHLNDELPTALAMFSAYGYVRALMRFDPTTPPSPQIFDSPYILFLNDERPEDQFVPLPKSMEEMGWGPALVKKYGMPEGVGVAGNPSDVFLNKPVHIQARLAKEMAGQARIMAASFAFLNLTRESLRIPAVPRAIGRKRSKSLKKFVRAWETHTVTLEPLSSLVQSEAGIPLPRTCGGTIEHSVRGHYRHYWSDHKLQCQGSHSWETLDAKRDRCSGCASRRVIIDSHIRGDAEVGSTVNQTTYKVRA